MIDEIMYKLRQITGGNMGAAMEVIIMAAIVVVVLVALMFAVKWLFRLTLKIIGSPRLTKLAIFIIIVAVVVAVVLFMQSEAWAIITGTLEITE